VTIDVVVERALLTIDPAEHVGHASASSNPRAMGSSRSASAIRVGAITKHATRRRERVAEAPPSA
jgi:hypothetical protein